MLQRTGLRVSSVALLLCGWGPAIAQKLSTQATFRTGTRMVLVPVTVTDRYGKPILDLHADDFKVLDGQFPQRIVSFSSEDAPCSVGLVLDVSGSMRAALGIAKEGARSFVQESNPNDEFVLLTVSTQPDDGPFTTDAADFAKKISYTQPTTGMTALIDTVYLGLNQMRKAARPQRALIVLSDGMDNHSRYSRGELLSAALEADVQIYTITLDGLSGGGAPTIAPFRPSMIAKPGDRAAQAQGPELLEQLADKTGGLHFHARNQTEAKDALMKVSEALRNQYVIGFQPEIPGTEGKFHKIRVTTSLPRVYIHARNGYYVP